MPFKKGDPNINRDGRPRKGRSWGEILDLIGDEKLNKADEMTKREAIARKVWQEASKGENWAINMLMDRIDGKPRQMTDIDLTSDGERITGVGIEFIGNEDKD